MDYETTFFHPFLQEVETDVNINIWDDISYTKKILFLNKKKLCETTE